jgi:hypothetical protein
MVDKILWKAAPMIAKFKILPKKSEKKFDP